MYAIKEFAIMVVAPVAVLSLLAVLLLVGAYTVIDPRMCGARWPGASEWSFWGGCRVQTERGMVPQDMLQINDVILRSVK